jgi:hypothetical protein
MPLIDYNPPEIKEIPGFYPLNKPPPIKLLKGEVLL